MNISTEEAKQAAYGLRASLAAEGVVVSHGAALEHVAHAAGHRDWNTMAAQLVRPARLRGGTPGGASGQPAAVQLARAIPILRIFDEAKAREFTSTTSASPSTGNTASNPSCLSTCRSAGPGSSCISASTTVTALPAPSSSAR